VILERVYRYTVQETVLECPSGGLDGDSPEAAAHRELLEETGWAAEHMLPLGSFFASNGISDERLHVFLATGLREVAPPLREPTEQIELEPMPLATAVELALSGQIQDGPSVLALLLAQRRVRQQA
jgi:ADP-ribose pyrophosphatase